MNLRSWIIPFGVICSCNRSMYQFHRCSVHISSRIDRIKQPATTRGRACEDIFAGEPRRERSAQVDWPPLLCTQNLRSIGATALAGEYFTRVAKVTDRTGLRSFELHRAVHRQKIMHQGMRIARIFPDTLPTLIHSRGMNEEPCHTRDAELHAYREGRDVLISPENRGYFAIFSNVSALLDILEKKLKRIFIYN